MKKQTYLDYISSYLDQDAFEQFKASYQQKLPKSIKIIEKRIKKSDFFSLVQKDGRELSSPLLTAGNITYDDVMKVQKQDNKTLGSHFLHQSGYFYIQEVAAGLSAQVLDVKKGDIVLDLCAAPGGKSVQIADKLAQFGSGFLLANEPSNPRRKALIFNLNRCGLENTAVSAYRGEQIGELVSGVFDKVLVDAPCSGEGMQYKSDSKTTYRDPKTAQQLSKLQKQLLISGLKALKVGGELVYSTCTLNALENEQVISSVLQQFPGKIELVSIDIDQKSLGMTSYQGEQLLTPDQAQKVARFWPHIQHTGGFFIAKFKKNGSLPLSTQVDQRTKQETGYLSSDSLQKEIRSYLDQLRAIKPQLDTIFFSNENAIYCVKSDFSLLPKEIFIEKYGIPIFKKGHGGELIPQQGLAVTLGAFAQKNTIEISDQQAQNLSDKQDIQIENGGNSSFLITKWRNIPFSLVKQVGNQLKNKLY